jgi:hypothetical protein
MYISCSETNKISNQESDVNINSDNPEDVLVRKGKFDYQKNGVSQTLLIAWADSTVVQDYISQGGEDWFWFVSDLHIFFNEGKAIENFIFCVSLPEGLSDNDMKKLAKKLGNRNLSMGYYLIDGKKMKFIQHNLVESIIKEVYDFLGIAQKESSED